MLALDSAGPYNMEILLNKTLVYRMATNRRLEQQSWGRGSDTQRPKLGCSVAMRWHAARICNHTGVPVSGPDQGDEKIAPIPLRDSGLQLNQHF